MSSRRMFSSRITTSARFLKMPISCQALYFHLGMQADDDGVVEAFTVLRTVGCSEDDLRVLDAKGFVKVFNEDLVTYIVDWQENNKIRADRIVYSQYRDLLKDEFPDIILIEKKERADSKSNIVVDVQVTDNGQTIEGQWSDAGQSTDGSRTENGRSMDCLGKDRIGKVSIGEVSIEQERIGEERSGEEKAGQTDSNTDSDSFSRNKEICSDIAGFYFKHFGKPNRVNLVSHADLLKIYDCLKVFGESDILHAILKASKSDFLTGKNKSGWKASFDWIFIPGNMQKILDGKYNNKEAPEGSSPPAKAAVAAQ